MLFVEITAAFSIIRNHVDNVHWFRTLNHVLYIVTFALTKVNCGYITETQIYFLETKYEYVDTKSNEQLSINYSTLDLRRHRKDA
jgi:hypothetical protein